MRTIDPFRALNRRMTRTGAITHLDGPAPPPQTGQAAHSAVGTVPAPRRPSPPRARATGPVRFVPRRLPGMVRRTATPGAPGRNVIVRALVDVRHRASGLNRPGTATRRLMDDAGAWWRWLQFERGPRSIRILSAVSIGGAVAAVIVGVVVGPQALPAGRHHNLALNVAGAFVVMIAAHVARLRLRYGAGNAMITWGEAALLIMLYVVPLAWVPAITFAGCLIAGAFYSWRESTGTPARVIRGAANICLAATAAGLVATGVVSPYRARFTAELVLTLFLSAAVYFVAVTHLTAWTIALRTRTPFRPVLSGIVGGKLIMSIGNICVGLLVVAVLGVDFRWLLLLPPVPWLLQQGYAYQLSGRDERRAWEVFAQAARALNQLDERAVADAGIRAATALFGAEAVEIAVRQPGGDTLRYGGGGADAGPVGGPAAAGGAASPATTDDVVMAATIDPPSTPRATDRGLGRLRRRQVARQVAQPLQVGGFPVGELRMRVPSRPELRLREQMSLSAYADTLAAALHDAASHRQLHAVTARNSHEAMHDQLTGLVNRTGFQASAEVTLRTLPPEEPVVLLLLDIDNFREVNDTLGHAAGDQLLQIIASRLRASTAPHELLARLGGDEFAVLVTGPVPELISGAVPDPSGLSETATTARETARRAHGLTALVSLPAEVGDVQLAAEASVGAVVARAGDADATELLRRADIALHHAKRDGSGVTWYEAGMDAGSTDRLAVLAELREALKVTDQLVFHVQPAVDLATGVPSGVEVLPRWRHPRRGLLEPAAFVDAVEGSELIAPFTRYVVDHTLRLAAEWAAQGVDVPVSVNISPRGLLGDRLPDQVSALLAARGVPAGRLTLEITETVVGPDGSATTAALSGLRARGVRLAVDNFGSGYSSLTFLTRVPVDEIKIDQAFVDRMLDLPEAAAIVRTTVELGKDLKLRVVADGVHTADHAAALAKLGCTAAQGRHFFAPMPAECLLDVLREARDGH